MANCLQQILTEPDNQTHDPIRWLAIIIVLVALYLQVYVVVVRGQPFDMTAFGAGIGLVIGSVGLALKMKPDTKETT